jgi:peptide/nickel transport system substrate-binding protein
MLVEVPWNSITTIQTQHALFQFIPYESLSYDYLGINFRNSLLNIFEVREALSKAINRAQIISTIYSSEGQPISGPWGPQSPYICSQCPPDPYNPGYSRDLLKKAGLVDSDNDGIVEYEGKKVTLRLLFPKSPNGEGDAYLSTCNNFKGAFRAIGIDVDIVGLPPDKFYDKVFIGHDFDLAFHRWRFKDLAGDPSSLFSSSDTAKKMNNYIYYINKDIDELFNRFQMSRDLSTKKELGIQIHKVLAEDRPYIFLWSLKNNTAYNRTQFANININPFDFFYSIYDWQVR